MTITNWIIAISSAITTLTVVVLLCQLKAFLKQLKDEHERSRREHERSRREKVLDLLMHTDICLKKESTLARRLVEKLSETDVKKITDGKELEIKKELLPLVEGILSQDVELKKNNSDEGENTIFLNERQSLEIRWTAIQYLNLLETTLIAWHDNIVDKDIIEEQYDYLYDGTKNSEDAAMGKFRRILGKDYFPAMEAFISKLEENKKPRRGKSPTG